jgi:hypothetical protein
MILEKLRIRAEETEQWLREQTAADPFTEQRHCDAGTVERAYWHHGYLMALRDAIKHLEQQQFTDEMMAAVESIKAETTGQGESNGG